MKCISFARDAMAARPPMRLCLKLQKKKETPEKLKLYQQNKAWGRNCQKTAYTAQLMSYYREAQSKGAKDADKLY